MTDLDLITALMSQDTDALGFIPHTALETTWLRKGRYLVSRDRRNRRCGYLLHGPVHRDGTLRINQVCLDLDRRRRRFATELIARLVARARAHHATSIHLRCATDLEAIAFWRSIGAIPTLLSEGGKRRSRLIQAFAMPIAPNPTLQFRSCGPFGPPIDSEHLPARSLLGGR